MLINQKTILKGNGIQLVPYEKSHVQTYHEWLKDPELLKQTGSEPLTIEQEYEMQQSWALDKDKLTFIIMKNDEMAGDVNVYLNQHEADKAELEVMVAVDKFKRQGVGREALLMMMDYSHRKLGINTFVAIINDDNIASLRLFKSLDFVETRYSSVFKQYTLESSKLIKCLYSEESLE